MIASLVSGTVPSGGQPTTSSVPDTSTSSSSTSTSASTTTSSTTTTGSTTSTSRTLTFEPTQATSGSTVGVAAQLPASRDSSVPCELFVGASQISDDCAVVRARLVGWFTVPGTTPTGSVLDISACEGSGTTCDPGSNTFIASGTITVISTVTTTTSTSTTVPPTSSSTSTTPTTVGQASSSSGGLPPLVVVILVVLVGLLAASLSPPLVRRVRAHRRRRWFERHDSFRITSGDVNVGDPRIGNASDSPAPRIPDDE